MFTFPSATSILAERKRRDAKAAEIASKLIEQIHKAVFPFYLYLENDEMDIFIWYRMDVSLTKAGYLGTEIEPAPFSGKHRYIIDTKEGENREIDLTSAFPFTDGLFKNLIHASEITKPETLALIRLGHTIRMQINNCAVDPSSPVATIHLTDDQYELLQRDNRIFVELDRQGFNYEMIIKDPFGAAIHSIVVTTRLE